MDTEPQLWDAARVLFYYSRETSQAFYDGRLIFERRYDLVEDRTDYNFRPVEKQPASAPRTNALVRGTSEFWQAFYEGRVILESRYDPDKRETIETFRLAEQYPPANVDEAEVTREANYLQQKRKPAAPPICATCGQKVTLSTDEQELYNKSGDSALIYCPDCWEDFKTFLTGLEGGGMEEESLSLCVDCGQLFELTKGEQELYKAGRPALSRCPSCREYYKTQLSEEQPAPLEDAREVVSPLPPVPPPTYGSLNRPQGNVPPDAQKEQYQPAAGWSRLGKNIQTGEYVDVPQASRRQGLYIIGANGTGKTGLIEHLILQDINQGLGVGLLDAHGDLTNAILEKMTKRLEDVILLDITDEDHPFGLNLFACPNPQSPTEVQKIVDLVMHIFEKLYDVSRQTPRMAQYLRNCTYTLVANPGYTMAEIPLLLQDDECRKKLVAQVTDPQVRLFWKTYESMKPSEQRQEAASTINKMDEFLQPLPRNIVGQAKTTVNMLQVMDERKILLVKLSAQLDQVTSLVGSLIIALFLNAAYSRASIPINKRKQFNLYADEFQRFATEDFATLLTEARKFGIATTIAHQARYQPGMTDGIRAVSLQAANYVMFRVTPPDADELAGGFDITPQAAWEEELEEEWVEVLKEEWYERKEEEVTDGEEEIQTPVRDVVQHLLRNGHTSNTVNAFARYLELLDKNSQEEVDRKYNDMGAKVVEIFPPVFYNRSKTIWDMYLYDPEIVKDALIKLNNLLYQSMTGGGIGDTQSIEEDFARVLGYEHYYITHVVPNTIWFENTRKNIENKLRKREEAQRDGTLKYLAPDGILADLTGDLKIHVIVGELEYKWQENLFRPYGFMEKRIYEVPKEYRYNLLKQIAEEILPLEKLRYEYFHTTLLNTLAELQQSPITRGSGLYKPRTRKQITYLTHPRETITHPRKTIMHPQRPYQDVKNDIANQLSGLPPFTARVKIAVNNGAIEHTIKTLAPGQGIGKALQQRIADIQARNRNPSYGGYCQPRKAVETEITKRQTSCSGFPPAHPQPQQPIPQQPRHARQVPVQGKCQNCGASNLPGSKFCNQCGTML